MSGEHFQMPGGWEEPSWEQPVPLQTATSPPFTNYRVSNIDATFEKSTLRLSLTSALQLPMNEELRIWSLAPSLIYPEKKVATMSLKRNTSILKTGLTERQLFLSDEANTTGKEPVVIDIHFLGLTPLNDTNEVGGHKFDVVAISGIGGHAFGSFRAHGGDYMWLRDKLPEHLPGARIMVYGYDTQIAGSKSFQGLGAIGLTFKNTLRNIKRSTPISSHPIPIILIGHSMGGLVVKKAICKMAEGEEKDKTILKSIYGILFFGVPNQGMENKSLVAMARGQPNESLIQTLGTESEYLEDLHMDFQNKFTFSTSIIFSFFETEESPTAIKINEKWVMEGPTAILVGRASATQGRHWERDSRHVQPINRTHSRLVKFTLVDQYYDLVLEKLRGFTDVAVDIVAERLSSENHGPPPSQVPTSMTVVPRLSWPLTSKVPVSPKGKRVPSQQALDYHESASTMVSKESQNTTIDSFQMLIYSQNLELGSRQEMQRQLLLQVEARRLQEAFLQSITPSDYQSSKIIPNPFKGTCQWLLKKEQYKTWKKPEPSSKALIIMAGTGRGKSVLAKYLTQELDAEENESIVLSVFCKNDNSERKTAVNVIQCLLHQLLLTRPELFRHLPNQTLERGIQARAVFQQLWDIFVALINSAKLGTVYCIIDGLDECDEKSKTLLCESITRDVLDSTDRVTFSAQIRMLITSQPSPEILNLGEASSLLEIMPSDVSQDIYDLVHQGISKVTSKNIVSVELATAIEEIIREKADGMFQWAALVLEDLNASNHLHAENRILELFRAVPESLNDLYERALNNIAVNDKTIAHQILKLLLFASRPLAEPELAFAFALMDDNENYHRHTDIIRSGNLEPIIGRLAKAVCGSFLKFSEEDRLLAVSHESARLFLVNHRMGEDDTLERAIFNVDEGHLILAKICLQYLLLEEIRAESSTEEEGSLYTRYPFLHYAESSWNYHLEEVNDLDQIRPLMNAFFSTSPPSVRAWKAVWPELVVHFPDYQSARDQMVLHLLVRSGLHNVLMRCAFCEVANKPVKSSSVENPILLLRTEVDAVDSNGQTPLMISVLARNFDIVVLLYQLQANHHVTNDRGLTLAHFAVLSGDAAYLEFLRKIGVDLYRPDAYGLTPLYLAIALDNRDAIGILLESDPKYNVITGETALHAAALVGNEDLVRNLLTSETNVDRKTNLGDTVLKLGVQSANQPIVKMLLARSADPDLADTLGWSPLHVAAFNGLESIVDALLTALPNPDIISNSKVTPLMAACQSGSIAIVKKLLPLSSNVNSQDEDGETALHYAAQARSAVIVDALIDSGANVNIIDHDGRSVLHIAASEDLGSIMELLLSKENIKIDQPLHHSGRTPLYEAVRSGSENLVLLLLRHMANPEGIIFDMIPDGGDAITALQAAANNGTIEMVKHLVAAGANLEATWKGGFTPLHAASINNHTAVIKFLLDNKANALCRNRDSISPQHYLARNGEKEILDRLLNGGSATMWTNGKMSTPLHWACRGGSVPVVKLLLEHGLDPKSVDEDGVTPLHEAASAGHVDICKMLLKFDINIDQQDNGGCSVLHHALSSSQSAVAELLLSRNATSDSADSTGWTPLHIASRRGLGHVVQLILRRTSQIDCLTNQRATPLSCAIFGKHVSVARILIRSGANANIADANGWAPLHWAASLGSKELVMILLNKTQNIDHLERRGVTPLFIALSEGFDHIAQILLMSGASTDMKYSTEVSLLCPAARFCNPETFRTLLGPDARGHSDNDNWSLLHYAVLRNDDSRTLEVIRLLLEDGADPNQQDLFENTPLHMAAMMGHRNSVISLVAAGGDLELIDCYGRTAYYWAKRLYNNQLPSLLNFRSPLEPDEDVRLQTVEKSISRCIVRLKKSKGSTLYYYEILGKCLQFQSDPENAVIAFEQQITRDDEGFTHSGHCTAPFHSRPSTNKPEPLRGTMYVCSSCESVCMCEVCLKKIEESEAFINGCFGHTFLRVPRPEWETLPQNVVDKDGRTVQEWLTALRDTTEDDLDGLQIWRTTRWTQSISWRQAYGGMWNI